MITIEGFLLGCFLVTAVYHFFLFIFYKKNYAALYFALITFSSFLLTWIKSTEWIYKGKSILIIFIIVPILYIDFTRSMYKEEFQNLVSQSIGRFLYIYAVLFTLGVIITPNVVFLKNLLLLQRVNLLINMSIILYMFVQLIRATINKKSDAKIILLGYFILFISAIIIYIVPSNMLTKNNPIGALGILVLYSVTLARRYSYAYHVCGKMVDERTAQLKEKNDKLVYLLNHDVLTDVYSRRYIMEKLESMFNTVREDQGNLSMISLDIDNFKKINDRFGHFVGDEVLVETTKTISSVIRPQDILGRTGGEEFLILLPDLSLNEVIDLAECIRKKVNKINFENEAQSFHISCSIGVVTFEKEMKNYDDMLLKADKLLYKAKEIGRNRVCYA